MAKATGPGIPNCAISNTAKGMMIGGLDREVEVSVRRRVCAAAALVRAPRAEAAHAKRSERNGGEQHPKPVTHVERDDPVHDVAINIADHKTTCREKENLRANDRHGNSRLFCAVATDLVPAVPQVTTLANVPIATADPPWKFA